MSVSGPTTGQIVTHNLVMLDYRTRELVTAMYIHAAGAAAVTLAAAIAALTVSKLIPLMAMSIPVNGYTVFTGVAAGFAAEKNPEATGKIVGFVTTSMLNTVGSAGNAAYQAGKDVAAKSLTLLEEEEPTITFHDEIEDTAHKDVSEEDESYSVVTFHAPEILGGDSFMIVDIQ